MSSAYATEAVETTKEIMISEFDKDLLTKSQLEIKKFVPEIKFELYSSVLRPHDGEFWTLKSKDGELSVLVDKSQGKVLQITVKMASSEVDVA